MVLEGQGSGREGYIKTYYSTTSRSFNYIIQEKYTPTHVLLYLVSVLISIIFYSNITFIERLSMGRHRTREKQQ